MSRTKAREMAFKVLFQVDLTGASPEESLLYLAEQNPMAEKYLKFTRELVAKTLDHLQFIDTYISKYSPEWTIRRMAVVDRNLMRLALGEMLYTDIDPAIAINEAVELAKKFGDENSSSFINAILDKIMGEKREIDSGD